MTPEAGTQHRHMLGATMNISYLKYYSIGIASQGLNEEGPPPASQPHTYMMV
jgi:hypothetical protein